MSLFEEAAGRSPLADRMRPQRFEDVAGQKHLVAKGAPFRSMVESGSLSSAILWGPPGVGKTTLGRLVAHARDYHFVPFSAVLSGIKEVREVMKRAQQERKVYGRRTLVFIDEIHRFNRAQQDAFLPHVESGDIVLLGATTENPSFEVNAALLSRCAVFVLHPIAGDELRELLARAARDAENGLGEDNLDIDDDLYDALAVFSDGDARRALNALETVASATAPDDGGRRHLTRDAAKRILHKQIRHDKSGENHFDVISALIKSVRNSDPDAAVYWLARLLEGGEDVNFVARRLIILASEDVGLADPNALAVAVAAQQAAHMIGLPEAKYALTEATLYLALAPKSNSALTSYARALADITNKPVTPVPLHLRNAATSLLEDLDYGKGYRYAHDDPDAGEMSCLPEELAGQRYYQPGVNGHEAKLAKGKNRG